MPKIKAKTKTEKKMRRVAKSVLMNNSETKYYYTYTVGLTTVSYAGIQYDIFSPSQGTSSEQRVGSDCRLLYCDLRFRTAATASSPEVIRVIVYIYKSKSNVANPALGLPIYMPLSTSYTTALSPINHKTIPDEATIVYDKLVSVNNGTDGLGIYKRINLFGTKCQLDSSGYGTNKVYVEIYGQSASTNGFQMATRIAYKDI